MAPHEERQSQIVEAARKTITDLGMEHLTISVLADEIGISEAGIYRHVSGKREILLLVLEDIERTLLEAVLRQDDPSPLQRLHHILTAHLSYSERRRGLSFMVLNEALRLDDRELRERAGQVVTHYIDAIRAVVEEGQRKGEISPDVDPEMAARLFFGMVQGKVTLWALRSHGYPLSEGVEELWQLYRRAVESGGGGPSRENT